MNIAFALNLAVRVCVVDAAEGSLSCEECVGFMWLLKHHVKCQMQPSSCLLTDAALNSTKSTETTNLSLSFVFQKLLFSLAKYAVSQDAYHIPGTPHPGESSSPSSDAF